MDTGQLLDLFTMDKDGKKKDKAPPQAGGAAANSAGNKASLKAILDSMGDLWDSALYETEYDLDNFMQTLK